MKIRMVLATTMFAVLTLAVCQNVRAGESDAGSEQKAAVTQSVYVCPHCHVMALKAGNCEKCGMALEERHVLGTKNGQAMLCECEAGCKACSAASVKDGKCSCGKAVKEMSTKGYYVCVDGCPEISDHPGKCACGKELTKVE